MRKIWYFKIILVLICFGFSYYINKDFCIGENTDSVLFCFRTVRDSDSLGLMADFIKNHRQKVNYIDIIKDNRVVIFGERHGKDITTGFYNITTKKELMDNFYKLKELGFNVLGLEMFPAHYQYLLDRYYATGEGEQEILRVLKEYWGWTPETHLDLIKSAKASGIRIIGLNDGRDSSYTSDNFMVEVIDNFLENNQDEKLLVFLGNNHIFNIGIKLKEYNPVKISFWGGDNYQIIGKYDLSLIEQAVRELGICHDRFYLDDSLIPHIYRYNPTYTADYHIHLPSN